MGNEVIMVKYRSRVFCYIEYIMKRLDLSHKYDKSYLKILLKQINKIGLEML